MTQILMPKATAVWLIDNTALTFAQISDFCGLHPLEVEGIADGDVAGGIRGADPISNGQLSREEIEKAEKDPDYRMKAEVFETAEALAEKKPKKGKRRGPRYTPLSRRQDRPDAIAWLVRNHPELTDAQIGKLVGTTKPTIQSIRDRSHWKMATITPTDPVSLGLTSQIDLDAAVKKAADKAAKAREAEGEDTSPTLQPVEDAVPEEPKEVTLESLFKPQAD